MATADFQTVMATLNVTAGALESLMANPAFPVPLTDTIGTDAVFDLSEIDNFVALWTATTENAWVLIPDQYSTWDFAFSASNAVGPDYVAPIADPLDFLE